MQKRGINIAAVAMANKMARTVYALLSKGERYKYKPRCHQVKRLRTHGLIKKIGHCYKYYLTKLGGRVLATALKLKQQFIIPSLC